MSTDRVWRRFYADEQKRKDHKPPPQWVLDKIADEKADGGWDTRKANLCSDCHTFKSRNGQCLCDEGR